MKLTVIRHAHSKRVTETYILYRDKRIYGLTEEGVDTAEIKSKEIRGLITNPVFITSSLQRAKDTGTIFSLNTGWEVVLRSDLINELRFGDHIHSYKQMKVELGETIAERYLNAEYDFSPYGGDSFDQIRWRIDAFIELLRKEYSFADEIVAVSHNGYIRTMLRHLKNERIYGIDFCSQYSFEI